MLAPVAFAVNVRTLEDADAVTGEPLAELNALARALAMDAPVLPFPYPVDSLNPFTVT